MAKQPCIKKVYVTKEIGKYLIADEIDTHPDKLVCRLTDKSDGYYIVSCIHQEDYENDKEYYDNLSDLEFKIKCIRKAGRAIIQTGKHPKHDNLFFVNGHYLSFEQYYNVIQMLIKYIITIPYT